MIIVIWVSSRPSWEYRMVPRVAFATLKIGILGCMTMYPMNTAMPVIITAMHIKVQIMAKHQIKGWVGFSCFFLGKYIEGKWLMSRDWQHSARVIMVFTIIKAVNFRLGKVKNLFRLKKGFGIFLSQFQSICIQGFCIIWPSLLYQGILATFFLKSKFQTCIAKYYFILFPLCPWKDIEPFNIKWHQTSPKQELHPVMATYIYIYIWTMRETRFVAKKTRNCYLYIAAFFQLNFNKYSRIEDVNI